MGNISMQFPQSQSSFKRRKIFDSHNIYHKYYRYQKRTNSLSLNNQNHKIDHNNKILKSSDKDNEESNTQRKNYKDYSYSVSPQSKQTFSLIKSNEKNYKKIMPSYNNYKNQNIKNQALTQRLSINHKQNQHQNSCKQSQLFRKKGKDKLTLKYHQRQFQTIIQAQNNSVKKNNYTKYNNNHFNFTLTPKKNKCANFNEQFDNMSINNMNSAITAKNQSLIYLANTPSSSILTSRYQKYENKLDQLRKFKQQIEKLNAIKEDFLINGIFCNRLTDIQVQTQRLPQLSLKRLHQQQKNLKFSQIQNSSFKNKQNSIINLKNNEQKIKESKNSNDNSSLSITDEQQIQLYKHYQKCNIIIKKIRNFNDFLNEIKKKIKQNSESSHNSRNSKELKQDTNFYQPYQKVNLKCLNLSLKLQNQKIQLQKYKKLFLKQLSKQNSIQKISIQDKKQNKGQNSSQKIIKIQYFDLMEKENIKTKKNKQNIKTKVDKKYKQINKNVKELGALLEISKKLNLNILQKKQNNQSSSLNLLQSTKNLIPSYHQHLNIILYPNQQLQFQVNQTKNSDQIYNYHKKKHETNQKCVQEIRSERIQNKINFISKLFNKVNEIGQKQKQNQKFLLKYLKNWKEKQEKIDSQDIQT